MYSEIKTIEREVSAGRLLAYVEGISRFHRIQASQGHRDAANYINSTLLRNGVNSKILSYPFDYGINYLTQKAFQEWNCKSAELRLVSPEARVMADFAACATSVIQRSAGCDYSGAPLDIVMLDKGSGEENYEDIDLKGKLIFVRDNHLPYADWAVKKKGAVGIITDYVIENKNARDRHDMYDVSRYAAFWYYDKPEVTPFGFSITPREGDLLAECCLKTLKEHKNDRSKDKYPKAVCKIEAEFSPGAIEVVEAEIKGETDEEIWVVAHSCHPKSCANDNGSGVAAAMEAICVISGLIKRKELKPLKRTLKVITMPEYSGTFPYLSDHGQSKCLGAINLDMVGGKQELGYGPLNVVNLSCATPSFVAELAGLILGELKKEVSSLSPGTYLPMFNSERVSFSGGSDHMILSDPLIGIPAPHLFQWPDVFYHTSGDTLDKISPKLMSKSAALTASYVYTLCNLELEDVQPILSESLKSYTGACVNAAETFGAFGGDKNNSLSVDKAIQITRAFYSDSARTFEKYLGDNKSNKKLEDIIANHIDMLQKISEGFIRAYSGQAKRQHEQQDVKSNAQVPVRLLKAVLVHLEDLAINDEKKKLLKSYQDNWADKHTNSSVAHVVTQHLIDGKRSVDEIADMVLYETKGDCKEAVVRFIHLCRELGLCEFRL